MYFFGFLSAVYTFAVLSAWCLFILYFFSGRADENSSIPLLVWSYGVATGPIAYLAQKDLQSGNEYGGLAAFFSQVAFVLVMLAILLVNPSNLTVIVMFGTVMAIGMLLQLAIAFAESRAASSWDRT